MKSSIDKKTKFLTKHFGNIYRNSQHNLVFSDEGELPASHMFAQQVRAFLSGEAITLPYPLYNDEIYAWLTFAENPDSFKKQIVEEISDELKGLTKSQVDHLGAPGSGILSSVFYEFSDQSDYLHSLIIGTPAAVHLKAMIDHSKGHR